MRASSALVNQGRALAEPRRLELFEILRRSGRPLRIGELSQTMGLHHNAVRQHLAILVGAELVIREQAIQQGRGRPALQFRVSPAALDRWGGRGPQEELALLLLEVIATGDPPREVGRRAGLQLAAEQRGGDPIERLVGITRRLGFEPVLTDELDVRLTVCPFAPAAARAHGVVCLMHLGIAEGICEADGELRVTDFVRHDPAEGRCRLRLARR